MSAYHLPVTAWVEVTEAQVDAAREVIAYKITSGPERATPAELEEKVTLAMSFVGTLTHAIFERKRDLEAIVEARARRARGVDPGEGAEDL